MAIETVTIGSHVWGREGKPLGRVTQLVVEPATGRLAALVIDHGPLSTERIADVALIDRSAHDEVFLAMDDDEAGRLPPFVKREVAWVPGPPMPSNQAVTFDPVAGFVWSPYEGETNSLAELQDSLYVTPLPADTVTETISGIPESSVIVSAHTQVITADGYKAGHLHGLSLDDQDQIDGVVITTGHLYKHHVRVPVTALAGISHQRIVLTKGLDDAMDAVNEVDVQPA
jgi:sporulation protein YlmC with PRC-barrel domain